MPLAFFCTLFFRHRKKSVSAPWDGQSQSAPESARQAPPGQGNLLCGASRGLSSGQTIGAVRTAVRPACCLPELRVANRLRRLYPLDTRFPSFPPAPLRIASEVNEHPMKVTSPSLTPESARQVPAKGIRVGRGCACGRTKGLSSGQTIGAARTAVRSACCLPELRVANRLRRLYPLDTRFPSFPPVPLRIATRSNRAPHRAASPAPAPESAHQSPSKRNFLGRGFALRNKKEAPLFMKKQACIPYPLLCLCALLLIVTLGWQMLPP